MQYGLLICKNTDNIGDDIQTYAQKRFLPQVDYYVDREHLDTFYPEHNPNEPVAVIMNAWYMYQKFNWPPSPYIHPLFVSMHVSKNDYFGIGTDFLDNLGREYMQQHAPIGARDLSTLQILKEKDIDSYLSGCMTLTLQLDREKKKNDIVYLVDLDTEVEEIIKKRFPDEKYQCIHHAVDYAVENISYDERLERVETLLSIYQDAKCVITSRLHCALPCLALETPVLMIYEDLFEDRVKTFLNLINYVTRENILNDEWDYDISTPKENKKDYLKIRTQLETTCKKFIFECELSCYKVDEQETEAWKFYWLKNAEWQKSLLIKDEAHFRKQIWVEKYEEEKQWYREQFHNYKARAEELQSYIEELLAVNSWLQNQCDSQSVELKNKDAYIADLQSAKDWLEQQSSEHERYIAELLESKQHLESQNEHYMKTIAEESSYIADLQSAKEWLEQQSSEHKKYIAELLKTKQWLESQSEIYRTELNKKDAAIDNLSNRISELENENSKLKYRLDTLKEDKIIKKIIKTKKYQV